MRLNFMCLYEQHSFFFVLFSFFFLFVFICNTLQPLFLLNFHQCGIDKICDCIALYEVTF